MIGDINSIAFGKLVKRAFKLSATKKNHNTIRN